METGATKYSVWDATATEGSYTSTFRCMRGKGVGLGLGLGHILGECVSG